MKIAKILLLAALVAPVCRADDSIALANQLLDLSGTATFMQQTFETGLKPSLDQMRAKGAPAELVDAIHAEARNFFQENFNWEIMKPKLAKLYADNYTEAELKDIIAFYQTPTGQKTLAKMPVLMQQSLTMSMSLLQEHVLHGLAGRDHRQDVLGVGDDDVEDERAVAVQHLLDGLAQLALLDHAATRTPKPSAILTKSG
jgi:hypothetical protein